MASEPRVADSLADYLADLDSILPEPADAQQAAIQVVLLYEESGYLGATFNLYFGDLSGQPYFAVALYSDRVPEPEPGREVDARVVQALIVQNQELLYDPRNNIGLWYDSQNDLLYLDISAVMPSQEEALRLGEDYNEKEGFDLERGEPFPIGGTGRPLENLPPPLERLPRLVRGEDHE